VILLIGIVTVPCALLPIIVPVAGLDFVLVGVPENWTKQAAPKKSAIKKTAAKKNCNKKGGRCEDEKNKFVRGYYIF